MKKQHIWIIALIVLALLASAYFLTRQSGPRAETGVELLKNGGFEEITGEGLPAHWLPDAYVKLPGVTSFTVGEGYSGKGIQIESHELNDARFSQQVSVSPGTLYRLSGKIKAQAEGGLGANLSIQDVYTFSESHYDTEGQWQEVALYGRTGGSQTEITVYARLGGYSGESVGQAAFDDLSLMAVDAVPEGATLTQWEKQINTAKVTVPREAAPATPWLVAVMVLFAGLLYWFARQAEQDRELSDNGVKTPQSWLGLTLLLIAAGLTRLLMAWLVHGFPVDIGCFTGWATQMANVGPGRFYISDMFSDYPPGYMLVLWPLGLIGRLLGGRGMTLLVKLPAILCDLGIIAILYQLAQKRVGRRSALWLSMLYAFNPLPYLAGSAWGQVDSVPSLLLVIAVLLIMDRKWRYALPIYVVSVLMKPQALMVGPLGLAALVMHLVQSRDKDKWKDAGLGVGLALVAGAALVLPFFNEKTGFQWLFDLYGGTMSYYDYATVNATNLYFLFSKNWIKIDQMAPILLRLTGMATMILPVALAWHQDAGRKDKKWLLAAGALLPALAVAVPMNMATMGILLMASVFLLVAWRLFESEDLGSLPLLAGVLLTGFSILGTMMHERYLMMAVVLLILAYVLKRDRRLLWLILATTLLCFLNSGVVLDRGIRIGGPSANLLSPELGLASDSGWLEMALSVFSLPVAAYALYLGIGLTGKEAAVKPLSGRERATQPEAAAPLTIHRVKEPVSFKRWDKVFILVVTLLYALLAFINLGATQAPETAWVSDTDISQATLDLGEVRDFKILYYGGIHWRNSDFTLETSADGETWTSFPAQMREGDCFTWLSNRPEVPADNGTKFMGEPILHTGRYVRISSPMIGLTLYEVLLRDAQTGETLPVTAIEESSKALVDEQSVLKGEPGWFNSMYFDEIYHGRTAFEQWNAIRGQEPSDIYETTHPPLGKLLMTFSLMIFGMTPFGWRFAGALAGVLMLPGMYLLGKQITRRRAGGVIAMLMMAFDFMHFTQTRIATIDSFVTLFIIYAYFFMFRYMMQDYFGKPLKKTLLPLALSGVMMGLAVASKWPGVYAGIGLALLFFWAQARWARQALAIENMTEQERRQLVGDEAFTANALQFRRRFIITCLSCLGFFVLVPLVIYTLSFIPMFIRTPGGFGLSKVVKANQNMFDYHSEPGRGADHFFHSPWYQWPLSAKPMWYYAGGVVAGTASTILAFGNPLIWWSGLVAMVGLMALVLTGLLGRPMGLKRPVFDRQDMRPAMLVLAFLAQYLPWVMVPRGTYIYHYFPALPFVILSLVLWQEVLSRRFSKWGRWAAVIFLVAAAALFVAFFPYLSGVRVSTQWLDAMKWFPGWLYY